MTTVHRGFHAAEEREVYTTSEKTPLVCELCALEIKPGWPCFVLIPAQAGYVGGNVNVIRPYSTADEAPTVCRACLIDVAEQLEERRRERRLEHERRCGPYGCACPVDQ